MGLRCAPHRERLENETTAGFISPRRGVTRIFFVSIRRRLDRVVDPGTLNRDGRLEWPAVEHT